MECKRYGAYFIARRMIFLPRHDFLDISTASSYLCFYLQPNRISCIARESELLCNHIFYAGGLFCSRCTYQIHFKKTLRKRHSWLWVWRPHRL